MNLSNITVPIMVGDTKVGDITLTPVLGGAPAEEAAPAPEPDEPEPYTTPEFEEWAKMPRWHQVQCLITEKIDGTNAQVYVPSNPAHPVLAGSRTRWVGPAFGCDNFGFGAWVAENAEVLRRLGPGRHYGEWWGAGVQRRYGLDGKRFSLFNAGRWTLNPETGKGGLPEGLPPELGVVPILHRGDFHASKVNEVIAKLYREGSVAAPGWRGPGKAGPEGVVIQVGSQTFKLTDAGDAKKGRQHHVEAAIGALSISTQGHNTCVFGQSIDGVPYSRLVSPGDNVRAAMYQVADAIVTADAAILDARKAAQP